MTKRFALLIGNGKYEDKRLPNLVTPAEDVSDLARVLSDPNIGTFDEVIELIDKDDDTIKHAMADFYEGRQKDDMLLLYYSGHGMLDSTRQLHLAASNSNPKRPRINGIAGRDIRDWMRTCRAERLVLVLDSCYSGAFARSKSSGMPVEPNEWFAGSGTGVVILTASTATQLAWEGDTLVGDTNSVFTRYLIQGLESGAADSDQDGRITLDEWYEYAYAQVIAHRTGAIPQTPKLWIESRKGEPIVIAQRPTYELPQWVTELLNSADKNQQLKAVIELEMLHTTADGNYRRTATETLYAILFNAEYDIVIRSAALGALRPELVEGMLTLMGQMPLRVKLDEIVVNGEGGTLQPAGGSAKSAPVFNEFESDGEDSAELRALSDQQLLRELLERLSQ